MNSRNFMVRCFLCGVVFLASTFVIYDLVYSSGGTKFQDSQTGDSSDTGRADVEAILIEDRYVLDNAHTSLIFSVSHFGLSYTYGRFDECSGGFSFVGGELAENGFRFVIKADSINTNNDERDKHLRGPDFFDTQRFPEIKFVTTEFRKVDGVYQATGDFTMVGQTRKVTMPIQPVGIGQGPFGKQRAGYFTKFTIKRSDFGMKQMLGQVGDNISITFSFEGVKK